MAPAAESPACATVELDSMQAAEPLPPAKGLAGKITLSGRFDDDASIQDIQASMDSSLRYQGVATAHGGPAAVSSWTRTAANIVGEIMGGGIMSLPAAMGQLGFVLGSLSILVFSAVVMHVGLVLRRIKLHYHPDAVSYSSVMRNLHGPVAENVTKAIIFVNWFLCAAYYLVSVTNSYAVLAEEANSGICQVILSVIAALTILPAIQIRTFHHMSLLAFVGIVTLMASLILSFVSLALYPKDGAFYQVSSADLWPVGGSGPLFPIQFFGNFGSIIFAFQGQSYFFEMIAEMKRPSEFNKSLFSANGLMTVNYLFTALYCFAVGGRNNPFLLFTVPPGTLRIVAAVTFGIHILIAYVLAAQPVHIVLHQWVWPKTAHAPTTEGQVRHFFISLGVLLVAFVIANACPFFADLQNIISGLCASPIIFGFPAYFLWRSARNAGDRLSLFDNLYIVVSLFFLFPICFVLGNANGILGMVQGWSQIGTPFSCVRNVGL